MSSPEATTSSSTSTTNLFKKRNRQRPNIRSKISREIEKVGDGTETGTVTESDAQTTTRNTGGDGDEDEDQASLEELLLLRSLQKRPTGIDLNRLNQGEKKKKKKKKSTKDESEMTEEEKWQMKLDKGGLIDGEDADEDDHDGDEEENDAPSKPRLVRQDNFQGETNTVDVDKHMMAYIESEMAKRNPTSNPNSKTSSTGPTSTEILKALHDPEDDLYRVAEKYRILQQQAKPKKKDGKEDDDEEGNVGTSAMMLSGIPEIDLGMEARLKNIEDTEKAKKLLYEQKKNRTYNPSQSREADEQLANARFFRGSNRREPQSDSDALARARGQIPSNSNSNGNGNGGGNRYHNNNGQGGNGNRNHNNGKDRRDMASDEMVMGRFKKRQRSGFK